MPRWGAAMGKSKGKGKPRFSQHLLASKAKEKVDSLKDLMARSSLHHSETVIGQGGQSEKARAALQVSPLQGDHSRITSPLSAGSPLMGRMRMAVPI